MERVTIPKKELERLQTAEKELLKLRTERHVDQSLKDAQAGRITRVR